MRKSISISIIAILFATMTACGGGGHGSSSTTTSSAAMSSSAATSSSVTSSSAISSSSTSSTSISSSSAVSGSCSSETYVDDVICAINAFETTLTSAQLASAHYGESANTTAQMNVYKTRWSNLPGGIVSRAGIEYSALTTTVQTDAFFKVARTSLTDAGYKDFIEILAADDYLGTMQGGYGAKYAHIAIIGTPSKTGQWMLMLGNHHMAFNLTFKDGAVYPTPHHVGVEPKATFSVNGKSYQVLVDKAGSMLNVFYGQPSSLSSAQLTSSRLSATYGDILVGAIEYNTGSYATVASKFPTSNRGLLVSSLSTEQQALVTAAITQWASDYNATLSTDLIATYTSATAYANTYVAWSGPSSENYPNVDNNNTYMRIDGPRVWIEIACQGGIVIQGQTHYHMIFRDKTTDYYNELSTN